MTPPKYENGANRLGDCDAAAGSVTPVVDPRRCEAKGDCVAVCPYNVFEVRALTPKELAALPFATRIKVRVHGGKQALVARGDACHACGLCVTACPERAIKLAKTTSVTRTGV